MHMFKIYRQSYHRIGSLFSEIEHNSKFNISKYVLGMSESD